MGLIVFAIDRVCVAVGLAAFWKAGLIAPTNPLGAILLLFVGSALVVAGFRNNGEGK